MIYLIFFLLELLEKIDEGSKAMSALTKKERDGLDEVFLSIHTQRDKYKKFKELSTLILSHKTCFNLTKLIKQAIYGLKRQKISHFGENLAKKKKNLSK
jgi:hypothetical protein